MPVVPTNPHKRTDRIGSRFHTASNINQVDPPYVSETEGSKWLSSGVPFEEVSSLKERFFDLSWFILFPFVGALCFAAIWTLGLASQNMLDWFTAGAVSIAACAGLAAYIIAGRRLDLI
jgi:hypothetical protein